MSARNAGGARIDYAITTNSVLRKSAYPTDIELLAHLRERAGKP
jgi:hypothetical protein